MKKYISILFAVTVVFQLLPGSLRAEEKSTVDTMYMNKSAEFNYETQSGIITLENFVPGEMKVSQDPKPLDAILILDFSSSMSSSYSNHEDFTQTYVTKRYRGKDLGFSSDDDSKEGKTNKTVMYNGTSYDIYCKHIYDRGGTNKTYDWLYILVDGNKIYLRPDGSFVIPTDNNIPTVTSWPKSKDYKLPIEPILGQEMIYCETSTRTASTTTRALALQKAVCEFIDLLSNHTKTTGKKNRVSIASFQAETQEYRYTTQYYSVSGSTAYITPESQYYLTEKYYDYKYVSNATSTLQVGWTQQNNYYGRSSVIKRWTDISSQNALSILKRGVCDLTFASQTPHDAGANIAQQLMRMARTTENADSVAQFVIYFSDGYPTGTGAGFDSDVANRALNTTNAIKTAYPKAKVYSIYCNSSELTGDQLTFMQKLSSDYKGAYSLTTGTKDTPGDTCRYYKWASDNLSSVFSSIAQQILVETSSKFDVNTKLADFVNNEYFQLPDSVDQSTAYDNVIVYENKCTGYNSTTKKYSWADIPGSGTKQLTQADGITITITKGNRSLPKTDPGRNDKIEIKGYDFSKNWCGMDISVNPAVPHGARLVIQIPFVYTTTQVWGDLPTNSEESGVTIKDKETGEEIEEKKYPIPTLPFCYIKIQRDSLHKGESAIYVISKPDGEFIDKVVINGTGSGVDTCALYGVPGESFLITETNWNWAYSKTNNPQTVSVQKDPSTGKVLSYQLSAVFEGNHKEPTGSSTHEKEVDPANLHNHDEAYKVNLFNLPKSK